MYRCALGVKNVTPPPTTTKKNTYNIIINDIVLETSWRYWRVELEALSIDENQSQ